MTTEYNLASDRRIAENNLVISILKFPEMADKIDEDLLRNRNLKVISSQIKALYREKGHVDLHELEGHAIPRLVGNGDTDEESASIAITKLHEKAQKLETSTVVHQRVAKLKEIVAKEVAIETAETLVSRVHEGDDIKKICSIGNELLEIGSKITTAQKQVSLGDAFESLMNTIHEARAVNGDIGVPYPIKAMSDALGTMFPSDLVVIAARPAVGKTALALNLCRFTDEPMGFISSEMAKEQLAMRFVAMDAGIPANRIRDAKNLTDSELERISEIHTQHKGRKLYVNDKGGIDIGEIEDQAESWVALYGMKVLVVDYAQRINSDKKHQSESERIGHVTKRLKELAKHLGICVVLLAQINRDSVKGERPPKVHDLKGSGDIEQEADTIVLMHKPSMGTDGQNDRCIVEMIIDKNRHGPIGTLVTEYVAKQVMFTDPSEETKALYANQ